MLHIHYSLVYTVHRKVKRLLVHGAATVYSKHRSSNDQAVVYNFSVKKKKVKTGSELRQGT